MIMSKKWYVVQAYSQYEMKVKRSLIERIERAGLEEFFGEILVPTEEVSEVRDGKRRTSERKFFPGYVLVEMEANDEAWHLVKSTPQVSGFIGGTSDKPFPLPQKEIDSILGRMKDGAESPRPRTLYNVGEGVRIIEGPFSDFNAIVEAVDYDKSKLKVSVEIFGRATPVELEFYQVEKL